MKTLLIANRGEIALRILRTASAMGLRTVAVYSDADRDAPHVEAADAAVRIGRAAPAASYLNVAALVDAARASGADAVHPGYGFLAENADFAQAVLDAGLVFVGPPPAAIRAMAHKAGAKRLMADAGVPCVPGYAGAAQDDATLAREAQRIGYPVMVKAAAGGGGRGMRRVARAGELADALRAARSEAAHAFGSDELILERAIDAPRHVEVQVFADAHGNVVHLGERDCSVQRRHQKLIEEAPSPAVAPALRARMGDVAVAAARAIRYVGAGTLEFLLARDGSFHFMEMNTRLQVEHAVTEAITGLDLVEWQLRVARGEALPLDQPAIDARLAAGGHAIEARLCAEDPAHDFVPQSGRVALWEAPYGVRVDHALATGAAVPPHYDSMLAKLVAHAPTRADAVEALADALDATVLLGFATNRRFLAQCLRTDAFRAGDVSTDFVATHVDGARRALPPPDARTRAVAALLELDAAAAPAAGRCPAALRGWSNAARDPVPVAFALDGVDVALRAEPVGAAAWRIHDDDGSRLVARAGAGLVEVDGEPVACRHVRAGDARWLLCDGIERRVTRPAARRARADGAAGDGQVRAPLTGRVVAVAARPGERVGAGATLVVVEAMKMEHALTAPRGGRVGAVHVAIGDAVAAGTTVASIDADP